MTSAEGMTHSPIHGYGKIYNLGHKATEKLLEGPVVVEEKVDGSQFSFMRDEAGVVHLRSKRVPIYPDQGGMFERGVRAILERADLLRPGYSYRGEFLAKPKHNTLAYARVPGGHVVLFDVDKGEQDYATPEEREALAEELGLEAVPVIHRGVVTSAEEVFGFLDRLSFLGGNKVEGVVIKNYGQVDPFTGKTLMAKHVSEAFKETHSKRWKQEEASPTVFAEAVFEKYRTPARWEKAVQHLRESGELTDSPQDIGRLIKEVQSDVWEECAEEIKEALFKWAWKKHARKVSAGLPEWYKGRLVERQFSE